MARFFKKETAEEEVKEIKKEINEKKEFKTPENVEYVEREINLSLLNDKLNLLIAQNSEIIKALEEFKEE